MKYEGTITHPQINDGAPIPLFSISDFINTTEGWNLYSQCHRVKNMQPYCEAREVYNREHGIDSTPDPIWQEFIKGRPTLAEVFHNAKAADAGVGGAE